MGLRTDLGPQCPGRGVALPHFPVIRPGLHEFARGSGKLDNTAELRQETEQSAQRVARLRPESTSKAVNVIHSDLDDLGVAGPVVRV